MFWLLLLLLQSTAPLWAVDAPKPPEAPNLAWEIREAFSAPESAYYNPENGLIFVSNVAGSPGEKDGKGWISRLSPEGKVLEAQWVSGLNAPKGMRSRKGRLYVADIDELVEIDVGAAKVAKRFPAKGAKMLNDVAIGSDGTVFVSDTMGVKVWRLTPKGKFEVFLEGKTLEAPNGLAIRGGRLWVAGWGTGIGADWSVKAPGSVWAYDLQTKARAKSAVAPGLGQLDGLEADGTGWFISDWVAGKIYRAGVGNSPKLVLEGFKNSADIGWMPKERLLLVPRMGEDAVSAYRMP